MPSLTDKPFGVNISLIPEFDVGERTLRFVDVICEEGVKVVETAGRSPEFLLAKTKAAGIKVIGKDVLPRIGELSPNILRPAIAGLLGEALEEPAPEPAASTPKIEIKVADSLFPRPPTMCVACPHLGIYYCLSKIKKTSISGDIGCYTLGAGHPWNALDTTICMGASMGVALGMDKGRVEADKDKRIIAVIGDCHR